MRLKAILCDVREKILQIDKWAHLTKQVEYVEVSTIEEYLEFLRYLEARDADMSARLMEKRLLKGEKSTIQCLEA